MSFFERFENNWRETGIQLIEFEATKLGLNTPPTLKNVESMVRATERTGAMVGLDENQQARALVHGANISRGLLNSRVNGRIINLKK